MGAEHTPYLAHLKRNADPDTALAERVAVQEMLASPGWQLVSELLDRTYEEAVKRLLFGHAGMSGGVLDQAEYARLLGFLSGLRQTRWAAEAIVQHAERVRLHEE